MAGPFGFPYDKKQETGVVTLSQPQLPVSWSLKAAGLSLKLPEPVIHDMLEFNAG